MSEHIDKPQRRTRRRFVIGGVLLAVALLLLLNYQRQQGRVEELRRDIVDAGGGVRFADPTFLRLWAKLRGQTYQAGTVVHLKGPDFNSSWLQNHDNLGDVQIDSLELIDTRLDGSDLGKLVAQHPLMWLSGQNIRNADVLAQTLGDDRNLYGFELPDSDLSDAGLRALRLEQLVKLDVAGTQVTSIGLQDLKECQRLGCLIVDGRQFDGEIKELILNFDHPSFSLILRGPTVTDQHIELLREMHVGSNVLHVVLIGTSASPQAIKELQSEFLPPFRVTVR